MTDPGRVTATIRRVLPAPPEAVFDAWLDAEAVAEFITPAPARSGRIEWVPRVGGSFVIEMVDAGGIVRITGRFEEVVRPTTLRFTWHSTLGDGFDSEVTVTLEPDGHDATLMTIVHARLPSDWVAEHERGWGRIASQLGGRVGRLR